MDKRQEALRYYEGGGAKGRAPIVTILGVLSRNAKLGRTLDIGCGNGAVLEALSAYTHDIFGVDVSEEALSLTRERLPAATVAQADVQESLPFTDDYFDSVLMLDVIEHLQKPIVALAEIRRVLRAGGLLAITTPNAASPVRYVRGEKWFGVADPGHVSLYTVFTLTHALKRAGFRITMTRIEPFTGTVMDPLLRAFRVGGTLFVASQRAI